MSELLNQGNGAFAAAVHYAAASVARSLAEVDLRGDGNPDLAVAGCMALSDREGKEAEHPRGVTQRVEP